MQEHVDESDPEFIRAKINTETARIPWSELQRFFASGKTLLIDAKLDLLDVAFAFHQDNTDLVENWLGQQQIQPVSDEQAKEWVAKDSQVWAVVVKPWVLIQSQA